MLQFSPGRATGPLPASARGGQGRSHLSLQAQEDRRTALPVPRDRPQPAGGLAPSLGPSQQGSRDFFRGWGETAFVGTFFLFCCPFLIRMWLGIF